MLWSERRCYLEEVTAWDERGMIEVAALFIHAEARVMELFRIFLRLLKEYELGV